MARYTPEQIDKMDLPEYFYKLLDVGGDIELHIQYQLDAERWAREYVEQRDLGKRPTIADSKFFIKFYDEQ